MIASTHLPHRRGGAPELHQIAAEREHALRDAGVALVAAEDLLLDVVEAVVDRVVDVEVAVDDHVEERPEQEALLGACCARCAGARSGA